MHLKLRKMAEAVEKTADEQVQDGWKLLTFSITNTTKAILVFYTEENQG